MPARLRLHTLDLEPEQEHLARAYGNMAVAYHAVGRHLGEIHDFLAAFVPTVLKLERKMDVILERRVERIPVDPERQRAFRQRTSLGEFNPELTPARGVRFDPVEFERIEREIASLKNDKKIAEEAKRIVAEEAKRAREKLVLAVKVGVAVGAPVLATLGALARHLLVH